MAAMIRKHLNDRPDKWHETASPQAFIALIGQCKL
jgi:adenosyl cobinamide kinase/adenosyl cobinamide phosphate guanylyltransferase